VAIWIDDHNDYTDGKIGSMGFLVEISPQDRATRYDLREVPGRTNMSGDWMLSGWLGSTNNTSCHAHGIYRVARVAKNGRRLVRPVDLDSAAAYLFLHEMGFVGLATEASEAALRGKAADVFSDRNDVWSELGREALEADDLDQVALCLRADAGDKAAILECEKVLSDAEAQD